MPDESAAQLYITLFVLNHFQIKFTAPTKSPSTSAPQFFVSIQIMMMLLLLLDVVIQQPTNMMKYF